MQKKISLVSLGLLAVGSLGYFVVSRDILIFYFFAHLGALGVMGLFGSAVGYLAQRKSRSFWRAFGLGTILPIISGLVAVLIFLWGVNDQLYCGGSVSLVIGVFMIGFYLLIGKRDGKPVT
jgi:hypothetical protein